MYMYTYNSLRPYSFVKVTLCTTLIYKKQYYYNIISWPCSRHVHMFMVWVDTKYLKYIVQLVY